MAVAPDEGMKLGRVVALLAHPASLAAGTLAVSLLSRNRSLATRWGVGLPLSVLLSKALKHAYPKQKPRLLSLNPPQSMPSGHATATTVVFGSLVDVLGIKRGLALGLGAIVLVDVCRVHDKEHRVSEVLAGNVLGLAGAVVGSLVARKLVDAQTVTRRSVRSENSFQKTSPTADGSRVPLP
jgi:membrane-associated phospholipid phosphatase